MVLHVLGSGGGVDTCPKHLSVRKQLEVLVMELVEVGPGVERPQVAQAQEAQVITLATVLCEELRALLEDLRQHPHGAPIHRGAHQHPLGHHWVVCGKETLGRVLRHDIPPLQQTRNELQLRGGRHRVGYRKHW